MANGGVVLNQAELDVPNNAARRQCHRRCLPSRQFRTVKRIYCRIQQHLKQHPGELLAREYLESAYQQKAELCRYEWIAEGASTNMQPHANSHYRLLSPQHGACSSVPPRLFGAAAPNTRNAIFREGSPFRRSSKHRQLAHRSQIPGESGSRGQQHVRSRQGAI